tara:strand:+ start:94 stop:2181 length:2088 start_codon:yes stop_codon:yes gene_type:complete
MITKNLLVKIFFLMLFGNLFAQEMEKDSISTKILDEVIITATRSLRQLSSIPLPVILIPKEKINQSGTIRLNEILVEQTGINIVQDQSGFKGVQMQGISSDYIQILIDGVPLIGRRSGNFDLSRITLGNVKQIEIVKGPSSSLYGSEALGGVINIITEESESEGINGNLSYRLGTFNQHDVNVEVKKTVKESNYTFFINRLSTSGYDLEPEITGQTLNPFRNYSFSGKISNNFNNKLSSTLSLRFFDQNQDTEITINDVFFEGDTREKDLNLYFKLNHKLSEILKIDYEFYFTNYDVNEYINNSITAQTLSNSFFDQKLFRSEARSNYILKDYIKFTGGIGFQNDGLERTFFDEKVSFNSQYIFLQSDINLHEKFNLIIGGRFDNHSEYKNQFSPKIAMNYKSTSNFSLKGSIGYGFKAPAFRQLYFDFTNSSVGYTVLGYNVAIEKLDKLQEQGQILDTVIPREELFNSLEAESSIGYNLGLNFFKSNWSLDLNLFRNDFKNLIDTRIIARKLNGQNVFSYINFDKIYTTGLGFNAKYKFDKNFNISAGYQLLYSFDKSKRSQIKNGEIFVREQITNVVKVLNQKDYLGLENRSRHLANLKFFYSIPKSKLRINLRFIYRSRFAEFDTNGNGLIDNYDSSFIEGFVTTNLSATKTFFKKFDFQVGLSNNLIDYTDQNTPKIPGFLGFVKLNYRI